jgi:hypothetical protein
LNKIIFFIIAICTGIINPSKAQWEIFSPSGKIKALVYQKENGNLEYRVFLNTIEIVKASSLGILRADEDFNMQLQFLRSETQIISES